MPFLRGEWAITPELFDTFLTWLDPDRSRAGGRYEDIRRKLIKIFTCRGCSCPEDLADETINRVIARVGDLSGAYQGDPARYFGGVARNVFHEYARKRPGPAVPPEPDRPESREQELDCLDGCLGGIAEGSRTLILRYYEGEKASRIRNRNEMARELGTEPNALRIRAHRIRTALQQCVGDCLARAAGG